jgi:hypothetical protein
MSEMVERVADAIQNSLSGHMLRASALCAARAAIEAMRKPTAMMAGKASLDIELERPGNDGTNSFYEIWPDEASKVWNVMIDAALTPSDTAPPSSPETSKS